MTTNESSILAVEEFDQVLKSDLIVNAPLAVRLARCAKAYGHEHNLSTDEMSGIVLGAGAMYHALTGSIQ